eukprot:scaffold12170_cov180-Isochrysis_galbana.AAC.3
MSRKKERRESVYCITPRVCALGRPPNTMYWEGFYREKRVELRLATAGWKWWWVHGVVPRAGSSEDSFYPKKGGVESKTAGCNGVSVPPVGQRRPRRSPPALRPRIRWRREWVDNYQLSPSV